MISKTLKQNQNNILILDDEFLEYCRLNKIEDVEKLARQVFTKGFNILKYGNKPEVIPSVAPSIDPSIDPSIAPSPSAKMVKTDKSDLYGE